MGCANVLSPANTQFKNVEFTMAPVEDVRLPRVPPATEHPTAVKVQVTPLIIPAENTVNPMRQRRETAVMVCAAPVTAVRIGATNAHPLLPQA